MASYQLGPCKIEYPAGTDLGKTFGGVTVTVEETFAPLHTDQDGENPVDEYITGTMVTVEGSLADITIENLAKLFKQSVVTDGTKKKVSITPNVGTSLLDGASVMVIKPYDGGSVSASPNDYITLLHTGLRANTSLTYNATDQRAIGFTATGFPDTTTGVIAVFGDTSAA
jgi:hypothetical protein